MKIESHDTSIEKLLTGNYFVIPRFQRPYSWEEENIVDFWSDITGNAGTNYFIGSMVVFSEKNNTLSVVDGQQRITTIMIFMCAIRDAFSSLGEDNLADGLHIFIEKKNRDNKFSYVLKTETSFPFFQEKILKKTTADIQVDAGQEEKALEKASKIFTAKIAKKLQSIDDDETIEKSVRKESKIKWLRTIRDTILDLNVILIQLDNEDDAYLIFETLNTRGKDLALADLVKNLFARNLRTKGDVDTAKIKWTAVLDTIHGSDTEISPDTFIVHSWQSRYESVTKAKAYSRLKETINRENAKTHLDDFTREAEFYRSIFEPGYGWDKNQSKKLKSLESFQLFKLSQQTPAVLALIRAHHDKKIKFGKLTKTLRAIENFHFCFTAVTSSRSSGGISGMYTSFGRKIFEATDSGVAASEIKVLTKKLKERIPVRPEFDAGFEQIIFTNKITSQKNLVRYILWEIGKSQGLPQFGNFDDLTIEHLVPQNKISEKSPAQIIGQLGNLLLVDEETNGELDNKNFKDKKKILLRKGYQLPDEFLNVDEISNELIKTRTHNLAKIAYDTVWKI